jgi:hypothetical protein
MQKPHSAPTPQGRAGRLFVQQKEEAKERVKQQGRTTRSECGHSRPGFLSLRRQVVTLANPLSGPHSDANALAMGLPSRTYACSPLLFAAFEVRNEKTEI